MTLFKRWLGDDSPTEAELAVPIGMGERVFLSAAFLLFFELYYPLNAFTVGRPTFVPMTALDAALPFIPHFVFAYISIYYICVVPAFLFRSQWILRRSIVAFTTMSVISFAVFLIVPVEMVLRPPLSGGDDFPTWLLAMIYAVDEPFNCCPSLHVGLALMGAFTISCVDDSFGKVAWVDALLVCFATLFIKQHYILDIVVGFVVAYGSFWFWVGRHRRAFANISKDRLRESRRPSFLYLACYLGILAVTYGVFLGSSTT